jgi:hypothetical protein
MSKTQIKAALDTSGALVKSSIINDVLDGVKFRALAISIVQPDGRHAIGLSINQPHEAVANAYEMLLNCLLRSMGGAK